MGGATCQLATRASCSRLLVNEVVAVRRPAQVGLVPLLELLLQNGVRAGWADAAGRQPLHYAVLAGRTEAAKLLVSKPPCPCHWGVSSTCS